MWWERYMEEDSESGDRLICKMRDGGEPIRREGPARLSVNAGFAAAGNDFGVLLNSSLIIAL